MSTRTAVNGSAAGIYEACFKLYVALLAKLFTSTESTRRQRSFLLLHLLPSLLRYFFEDQLQLAPLLDAGQHNAPGQHRAAQPEARRKRFVQEERAEQPAHQRLREEK